MIVAASFLRIAFETAAPYFAKAYLVVFVQMWAPLVLAISARAFFRVTLPYTFLTSSGIMMLSSGRSRGSHLAGIKGVLMLLLYILF